MKKMFVYVCQNCRATRLTEQPIETNTLAPCSIVYGPESQCGGTVKIEGVVMVGAAP